MKPNLKRKREITRYGREGHGENLLSTKGGKNEKRE